MSERERERVINERSIVACEREGERGREKERERKEAYAKEKVFGLKQQKFRLSNLFIIILKQIYRQSPVKTPDIKT